MARMQFRLLKVTIPGSRFCPYTETRHVVPIVHDWNGPLWSWETRTWYREWSGVSWPG